MPKVSQQYKNNKRDHLISVAEQVFIRLGYAKATMEDILQEAEVSRGGIYLYFHNKAEIFEAVLERQDQKFLKELEEMCVSSDPIGLQLINLAIPSPEYLNETNRRWIAMVVEYHLAHRDDPKRRTKIFARFDRVKQQFSRVIQVGIDRGELHPRLSIPSIVQFIISAQDGWAISAAVQGYERADLEEHAQALHFFLQESLGISSNS
ncbi:MAG: TetR/AcrR family transcriptional regulator [Firmicutes bacterium]|nr:TetR/AcrR family transcriptional regulator [Bacillota bacterium]